MPSPKFPADEALKRGVALVHQGASATSAEPEGIPEVRRLPIVEYVAFAVVSSRTARWLISELRATFDRERLVCVDKRLTDRQLARS